MQSAWSFLGRAMFAKSDFDAHCLEEVVPEWPDRQNSTEVLAILMAMEETKSKIEQVENYEHRGCKAGWYAGPLCYPAC